MHVSPEQQLRVLREALPKARRVGFLYDPQQSAAQAQRYEQAARAAGLEVMDSVVDGPQQVVPVARALMERVDVLWLLPDSTVVSAESFPFLVRRSFETKVPLVGYSDSMCRAGALLALEVAPAEIGQHAAEATRQVLAGGSPAMLPSEGSLCLNARAAGVLQVPLPASLTGRAVRVIDR
jgi:putative ABC transport system substrate-binding protein